MFPEKIIQISVDLALTNKGRIFKLNNGEWSLIDPPNFGDDKLWKPPKGKTVFLENQDYEEKFNNSNNISDFIDI